MARTGRERRPAFRYCFRGDRLRDFLRTLVRGVLPLGEGMVLDPFCGAGSTLAAAEAVGYRSIGIENDPQYFDMASRAIPQLTARGRFATETP